MDTEALFLLDDRSRGNDGAPPPPVLSKMEEQTPDPCTSPRVRTLAIRPRPRHQADARIGRWRWLLVVWKGDPDVLCSHVGRRDGRQQQGGENTTPAVFVVLLLCGQHGASTIASERHSE